MTAPLELFSDFVCPFCFIAERSSLTRLKNEFDLAIDWRGFELRPDTPEEGIDMAKVFPASRLAMMAERRRETARHFGVTMGDPTRLPNTRKALAIAEWARDQGKLWEFRDAAMDSHWLQAGDLGDDGNLAKVASSVGLDGAKAVKAGHDDVYLDRVRANRDLGERRGVEGVPTSFIGHRAVVGCAPYEDFVEMAEQAGVARRGR
jgi:predicted DsbA family dithiol-disulfide isomerase